LPLAGRGNQLFVRQSGGILWRQGNVDDHARFVVALFRWTANGDGEREFFSRRRFGRPGNFRGRRQCLLLPHAARGHSRWTCGVAVYRRRRGSFKWQTGLVRVAFRFAPPAAINFQPTRQFIPPSGIFFAEKRGLRVESSRRRRLLAEGRLQRGSFTEITGAHARRQYGATKQAGFSHRLVLRCGRSTPVRSVPTKNSTRMKGGR
jgi:hypothetical protein